MGAKWRPIFEGGTMAIKTYGGHDWAKLSIEDVLEGLVERKPSEYPVCLYLCQNHFTPDFLLWFFDDKEALGFLKAFGLVPVTDSGEEDKIELGRKFLEGKTKLDQQLCQELNRIFKNAGRNYEILWCGDFDKMKNEESEICNGWRERFRGDGADGAAQISSKESEEFSDYLGGKYF
jgi:hypothetical protein